MSDNRSHIEEKYQWDLTSIFPNDQTWEKEEKSLAKDLEIAVKRAVIVINCVFFRVFIRISFLTVYTLV